MPCLTPLTSILYRLLYQSEILESNPVQSIRKHIQNNLNQAYFMGRIEFYQQNLLFRGPGVVPILG
jgi:hypothetical protein